MRQQRGWTQEDMATLLGIPTARYSKYERDTPMPVYLIPKFASLVGWDIAYVLTGRSESHPRRRRRLRLIENNNGPKKGA
jgi:transcriptional regulator with XRE-family HTH domain